MRVHVRYVCMYACMHACMHVCMCLYVYNTICVCIYVYVFTIQKYISADRCTPQPPHTPKLCSQASAPRANELEGLLGGSFGSGFYRGLCFRGIGLRTSGRFSVSGFWPKGFGFRVLPGLGCKGLEEHCLPRDLRGSPPFWVGLGFRV